ncbi:hypothetical protein OGM63_18820, partial [Plectonema radiosum NIES-515]|nr:hypothetical protein [Plectonema radiosum NIES-515]
MTSACFSADSRLVILGSSDGTLKLVDIATLKQKHLPTVSLDAFRKNADIEELKKNLLGNPISIFRGHTDGVTSVCLSADNRFALSGSADSTLKLWDVVTEICLRTFEGHADGVTSVCLSADSRFVLLSKSWTSVDIQSLVDVSTGGVGSRTLNAQTRFSHPRLKRLP